MRSRAYAALEKKTIPLVHKSPLTISCSGPAPAGFARLRGPLN
jgi:hypothetical protein